MILFDNIYYLLYNYFKRTNLGTFGYKLTSISLTSLYIYTFVCLFYFLMKAVYLIIIDASNTVIVQNIPFYLVNKDIFVLGSIICFIFSNIRYFTLTNIDEIYERINNMDIKKRERLNLLTVMYMVASPFLLFFMADLFK